MDQRARSLYKVQAGSFCLSLGRITRVMGVLNITSDSFSADGCLRSDGNVSQRALALAEKFVQQGADILDVGGESSRPGAKPISAQEEAHRVIPVIRALAKRFRVPISVDTYKEEVAQQALEAGAVIINNIKGTKLSKAFLRLICGRYQPAIILMHMQGSPETMQHNIVYKDVVMDIMSSLQKTIRECLAAGVKQDQIIIDPGIGFGKTVDHNVQIIRRLREFSSLNVPILIGTSRKSFIGKILDQPVEKRLTGSLATVCASVFNGAHIVRVHDIKETKEVVTMMDAIMNG